MSTARASFPCCEKEDCNGLGRPRHQMVVWDTLSLRTAGAMNAAVVFLFYPVADRLFCLAQRLRQQGAELVCFVAVNDPYVMTAWEESQKAKGKVLMLSDGNGDLSAAVRYCSSVVTNNSCDVGVPTFLCLCSAAGPLTTSPHVGEVRFVGIAESSRLPGLFRWTASATTRALNVISSTARQGVACAFRGERVSRVNRAAP